MWPALRAFQDGGIGSWDNFLVYTTNSAPTITLPLTNITAVLGLPVTVGILVEGPGTISYAWYTNNTLGGITEAVQSPVRDGRKRSFA